MIKEYPATASLKCKINSLIFPKYHHELPLTRIAFATLDTLIELKLSHESWIVVQSTSYPAHSSLIFIACSDSQSTDDVDSHTLYIHPCMSQILNHPSEVIVKDLYEAIPVNKIKYKYNKETPVIYNLPVVRRVKIMKMKKSKEEADERILDMFNNEMVISINEVIPIHLNQHLHFDLFCGIYSHHIDSFIHFYKIVEIEYEDFDHLHTFVNDCTAISVKKCYSNEYFSQTQNTLNAFLIPRKQSLVSVNVPEIEIIPNNFEFLFTLPKFYYQYIQNSSTHNLHFNLHDINGYLKTVDDNMNLIKNSHALFCVGPSHCGVKYIFRKIADATGMKFVQKDIAKFKHADKFITCLKKLEFMLPSCIVFKHSSKLSTLFSLDSNNASDGTNYFEDIKKIIGSQRVNDISNTKNVYIFRFENLTEINPQLMVLADGYIEWSLPGLDHRMKFLKTGLENLLSNVEYIFNCKLGHKLRKMINRSTIDISSLNYFDIAKLIVGNDVKEIKYLLKQALLDFYQLEKQKNPVSLDFHLIKITLDRIKKNRLKQGQSISSIPEIKWENIGGLDHAKDDIHDTLTLPLKYPKLFENSLKRRSGLLLYGPPGSGKTLLAKAIANECSMNFISVKGPELLNMYVGESEKNIREIFEKGRSNRPCVLFFDEIDALTPQRAKNSDQNNVMDRIVAQFMTEMDSLISGNDLIIMASTNRPDLVEPSLLRPGRFDRMIYVGLPKSQEEKVKIFQAQTLGLNLTSEVDLNVLSQMCQEDYSGADIYAVCSSAFSIALKECLKLEGSKMTKEKIILTPEHFIEAIKGIAPSLTSSEIRKFEEMKLKYSQ